MICDAARSLPIMLRQQKPPKQKPAVGTSPLKGLVKLKKKLFSSGTYSKNPPPQFLPNWGLMGGRGESKLKCVFLLGFICLSNSRRWLKGPSVKLTGITGDNDSEYASKQVDLFTTKITPSPSPLPSVYLCMLKYILC